MGYVLRETIASKRLGKPIWFQQMTGIGPMTTANPGMAAIYATKQDALASPAMRFALTMFSVEPAPRTGRRSR